MLPTCMVPADPTFDKARCVVCSSVMSSRMRAGATVVSTRCARGCDNILKQVRGVQQCYVQGSRGCIRRRSQVCSSEMSVCPRVPVRLFDSARCVVYSSARPRAIQGIVLLSGSGVGGVGVGYAWAVSVRVGGGGGRGGTCTTTVACTDLCLNVSIPARQPGEPWR